MFPYASMNKIKEESCFFHEYFPDFKANNIILGSNIAKSHIIHKVRLDSLFMLKPTYCILPKWNISAQYVFYNIYLYFFRKRM